MKFLIEVNKDNPNVTDIYRKVLSQKAKAVNLVKEEGGKIIVEVWFNDNGFFETMVNLVLEVDFNKVVMINESANDGSDDMDETGGGQVEPLGEKKPVETKVVKVDIIEGGSEKLVEEGAPESVEILVQENVPKAEEPPADADEITRKTLLENGINLKLDGKTGKGGGDDSAEKGGEKMPKVKPGGIPRKRAGAEIANLFVIPEFPRELTLENVVNFFEPMKERVREAVTDVINVAIDSKYDCAMDWKDVVRVSDLKGKFLSDYDKTLSAKRIADVFEQHGYSIRFRAFLQLLRAHVVGDVKDVPETVKKDVKAEEKKTEVKTFDVLVDFNELEFLAKINQAEFSKEKVAVMIMNAMSSDKLSCEAKNRFYYMLISAMAVKEYKPEGVALLLEDIAKDTDKHVANFKPETENEINSFVKQFTETNGKQLTLKSFMKLVNEYFRDAFVECDLEFIHRVVSFEDSFNLPKIEVKPVEIPKEVKRFKSLNYPDDLEDAYTELWNSGAEISEIVVGIFNYMAGEEIPDNHVQYLSVCAEAIAFDDLNFVYLDMGVSSTQAKLIQGELASILEDYTKTNDLPNVKLYDFLCEIRKAYREEA